MYIDSTICVKIITQMIPNQYCYLPCRLRRKVQLNNCILLCHILPRTPHVDRSMYLDTNETLCTMKQIIVECCCRQEKGGSKIIFRQQFYPSLNLPSIIYQKNDVYLSEYYTQHNRTDMLAHFCTYYSRTLSQNVNQRQEQNFLLQIEISNGLYTGRLSG